MNAKKQAPRSRVADALDNFVLRIGRVTSWLYAVLVAIVILQVVLRYGFAQGKVALEELQWHLYAVAFLMGLSYALVTNSHVRVDILTPRFPYRTREWVEIFGIVFLLIPFIILVILHSLNFVWDSWTHSERSAAPMRLPYRWLIKSFIPICFALWGLSAVSRVIRAITYLKRKNYATD